jgi:CubicO group peptidase (beta-lactamase class C family)
MAIEGYVAPGFEAVQALYEHNMATLAERNTQLCVYVGETPVVDLWGSAIDDASFSGDSLVNVFSSGKSLEAIALAMLVDRGLLDYNAKITDYWPEFEANNKHNISIADLMRHEAGLSAFDTALQPTDMHPEQLKSNVVGAIIERQTQKFRAGPGNQREYHAITRGWIANEVFRRVEPAGRTMGEFLREEVSTALDVDVFVGLRDDELPRVSEVVMLGIGYQFLQGLIPKALGRKIELNLWQTTVKLGRLLMGARGRSNAGAPTPIAGMKKLSVFDLPAVSKGEMPSAGAKCSARGLAKLAAVMANGGRLGEQQIMGAQAHAALHDDPIERNMMSMNTSFSKGGLASFPAPAGNYSSALEAGLSQGREGYHGWMGLGGSIFQWNLQHKIGFAYVPTSLNVLDIVNERGKAYQIAVVDCLNRL